jgi:hypothetical protein
VTRLAAIAQTEALLTAVRHIRRLRGGSQSHLIAASDGGLYVTKFQNNPQHVRVLANEMLAGQLGRRLGLPVATVEVIDVPEWLIEGTSELRFEVGHAVFPCSAGRQLASRYVSDADDSDIREHLPDDVLARVANLLDFPRVLVLDKWAANCDGRQAVFSASSIGNESYTATFVDQGFCFNAGAWDFPDGALRGTYARNSVYSVVKGWEAFEPALSWAESISPEQLWRYAQRIPEEWYEHDSDGLTRICDGLYKRRLLIRDLITAFRKSPRNPFPNWMKG